MDSLKRAMERAKQAQQDRQRQVAWGFVTLLCCQVALPCLGGLLHVGAVTRPCSLPSRPSSTAWGEMLNAPGFRNAAVG